MKQVQDAYIVAATRTPIGRSHKGFFRNYRPDDLLATTLKAALAQVPGLDPKAIEDIVCGCAIPEAQQGLNVARIGAVLAGLPTSIGGITVNRFCASGLSAVAMAADRIRVGEADVMVAAGVAYAVTGNLLASLTLSLLEPTIQAFAFFFHEKAWERRLKKQEQKALAAQA